MVKQIIKDIDKKCFNGALFRLNQKRLARKPNLYNPNYYVTNQNYPYRGYEAMQVLLKHYEFDNVLDIGCGAGTHSEVFLNSGKKVTAIDYGESEYFKNNKHNPKIELVIADINSWDTNRQYDCVWCSHVLEHQLNVNNFLKKLFLLVKDGGILAITVPPLKSEMVGGHVCLWTPGLLLYNLILAGFDCSEAILKVYDKDISVIVRKKPINSFPAIAYDIGDIMRLEKYFPKGIQYWPQYTGKQLVEHHFNGNIESINWPE